MNIFVSYKREGGIDIAARVADYLKSKGHVVFYDILSMQAGRFDLQIEMYIEKCDCFIVILTEGALNSEWVQKEIKLALANKNAKIVPLIMPGFKAPANLDPKIASVLKMHGVEYNAVLFEQVMDKLYSIISPFSPNKIEEITEALTNVSNLVNQFVVALNTPNNADGFLFICQQLASEAKRAIVLSEDIKNNYPLLYNQVQMLKKSMYNIFDVLDNLQQCSEAEKDKYTKPLQMAVTSLLQSSTTALQTALLIKHKI